MGAHLSQ